MKWRANNHSTEGHQKSINALIKSHYYCYYQSPVRTSNEQRPRLLIGFTTIVIYFTQLWFIPRNCGSSVTKTKHSLSTKINCACAVGVFPLLARPFRSILDLRMCTGVLLIVGPPFKCDARLRMRSVYVASHYSLLPRPLAMILDYLILLDPTWYIQSIHQWLLCSSRCLNEFTEGAKTMFSSSPLQLFIRLSDRSSFRNVIDVE